jgi:hypothetical protein
MGAALGRVATSSGAALSDVTISMVSTTGSGSYSGVSDAGGSFYIPNVAAGAYRVTFSRVGFAGVTRYVTVNGRVNFGVVQLMPLNPK